MRTTIEQLKQTRALKVLGLCAEDTDRLCQYADEAMRRLLSKGTWWGTFQRIRCIVSDEDCLTWPRQVATPKAVALCRVPLKIRTPWYEFGEFGYGVRDSGNEQGNLPCIDAGIACCFSDMRSGEKIRVYADVTEDDDARILLQGLDENGNQIRTLDDGEYVDGEYVSLVDGPNITTNYFSALLGVQKPITNGSIRLYARNVSESSQRAIAVYEPTEELPQYRRSYIPGLSDCECTDGCEQKAITAMVKLEHCKPVGDKDWLLIGNIPALLDEFQSIKYREANDTTMAEKLEASAILLLNEELKQAIGEGAKREIQTINANSIHEPVPNLL